MLIQSVLHEKQENFIWKKANDYELLKQIVVACAYYYCYLTKIANYQNQKIILNSQSNLKIYLQTFNLKIFRAFIKVAFERKSLSQTRCTESGALSLAWRKQNMMEYERFKL